MFSWSFRGHTSSNVLVFWCLILHLQVPRTCAVCNFATLDGSKVIDVSPFSLYFVASYVFNLPRTAGDHSSRVPEYLTCPFCNHQETFVRGPDLSLFLSTISSYSLCLSPIFLLDHLSSSRHLYEREKPFACAGPCHFVWVWNFQIFLNDFTLNSLHRLKFGKYPYVFTQPGQFAPWPKIEFLGGRANPLPRDLNF